MKNEIPIYAIDFEGSKSLGIVEFAIVGISDGEIFGLESAICAPRQKISARDAEFFGITNKEASAHPPLESHAELFCGLRSCGIFAAHSCQAENTMLRSHIPSPGRVKNYFNGEQTLEWAPWIDSRKIAKAVLPNLKSEKLADVVSELSLFEELEFCAQKWCPEGRRKWHCAPYDALASALIIKHALPQIAGVGELARINGESCENLFS